LENVAHKPLKFKVALSESMQLKGFIQQVHDTFFPINRKELPEGMLGAMLHPKRKVCFDVPMVIS
jgi:hypothetical protein